MKHARQATRSRLRPYVKAQRVGRASSPTRLTPAELQPVKHPDHVLVSRTLVGVDDDRLVAPRLSASTWETSESSETLTCCFVLARFSISTIDCRD